ncbi:SMP-30/gluconolactonase/LRE family protein [Caldimonas tepidiphila]|uniref:SMP-30/gluconolactonase/LRE family protein n=1 Tax=Caldimonas tepidiphila TaxID=2315841 RepID=UPI000E5C512D|nr:SMP-30/gluconolactonase/LRE family protein [Caldimonas tepidiphila]
MTAQLLVDSRSVLGECVLWCERSAVLYWTDIEGACLYGWQAADGFVRWWRMPERLGSFALCERPHQLLLGLASGIALIDLAREAMTPVVPVEPGTPTTRINDGRCDPQGRFVFGMFNQAPDGAPLGHFYRVDAELRVERLPLPPVSVANSIAFSPDGSRMYFTDSPTREIRCAAYDAAGRIGTPRVFARLGAGEGEPDGSVVDAEGGLWNAQWDGGCVVRYAPDGSESARLALPASRPTCPAFGGPGLDRLFVSTARTGLDAAALRGQPHAGGVFALSPGWRGLPERRFATRLRP